MIPHPTNCAVQVTSKLDVPGTRENRITKTFGYQAVKFVASCFGEKTNQQAFSVRTASNLAFHCLL